MTLAEALKRPTLKVVLLFEITAGKRFTNWVATAGYANTFETATTLNVVSVKLNGALLTQRSSIADVDTDGGWYHDGAKLYARPDGDLSLIYSGTVQAIAKFYFSNTKKIFDNNFYDPRLLAEPSLSLRIERSFSGVGQIGGGSISFANTDHYFDSLTGLEWDAGTATLKLGADVPPGYEMPYADYETVATWLIDEWDAGDDFKLKLSELKSRLKRKLPLELFTRETYPAIPNSELGKPIPIAYGQLVSIKPVLISAAEKKFKVAGHAIKSFDTVKVKNGETEIWETVNFATRDATLAEFTLGAEFTGNEDVAVDFTGKIDGDGSLISNAADIVLDILETLGETNLSSASFAAAAEKLDIGTDEDGDRVVLRSPSLYISSETDAAAIIGEINKLVGSYLYSDATGQYYFGVFEPVPGEGLETLTDLDLFDFSEVVNATDLSSKVFVQYQHRPQEAYSQLVTERRVENRYTHNLNSDSVKRFDLKFHQESDAETWAQRYLIFDGQPWRKVQVKASWQAMRFTPGQFIRVESDRWNINEVFEVLEKKQDLRGKTVTLVLSDLRNLRDTVGFWRDDADALPERFSTLPGYGTGSLDWNKDWHPEIKKWARQNVGYWCDENGYADPADPDSANATAYF